MIDESNDASDKVLAMLASTYNPVTKANETKFIDLILCHDCTAEGIFTLMDTYFSNKGIPWTNVVAFESDNCSVMKGRHKGVIKKIQGTSPKVVDLACICHLCNLCVKKAANVLPFSVDDLLVDIYYHFECSTKRMETLKEYFRDYPDIEYRKMLKHSSTRWLSLRPCLDRLIKFYEPVSKYFIDCPESEKRGKARNVKETLLEPSTKPLLMFLSACLQSVDKYNVLFQTEKFIFDQAYESTLSLITDLLSRVLKPSAIRDKLRHDLDIDITQLLPSSEFDIGTACRVQLESLFDDDTETEHKVLDFAKEWILAFFLKLKSSFPLELLKNFSVLNPQEVLSSDDLIPKFTSLCELLGAAVIDELKKELRMLMCDSPILPDPSTSCTEWWAEIAAKYSSISTVLPYIFAIPNSNAGTERCFSLMKAIHTPVRNSLLLETLNALLHIKINKRTPSYVIDNKQKLLVRCKKATWAYKMEHSKVD